MATLRNYFCFFLVFYIHQIQAVQIGDKAPNFDAATTKGNISFHEWINNSWVVLFSHPGDFTPVCTTELASVAQLQPEFKKRNVKVIALSGDSIKDHLEWIPHINKFKDTLKPEGSLLKIINNWQEDTDVNYPIIADEDFSISTLYGMYHPNAKPNSNSLGSMNRENIRAVYIIDSNKTIQTILIYPKNIGRNFKEILRTIDALQLSQIYKISTPANWENGDPVIVSNEVPLEDIPEKYNTKDINIFEDYLKFIDQPEFFSGSDKSKKRSKGGFK
jgi:alkyl hydroperoxide reductase subunit AhpC